MSLVAWILALVGALLAFALGAGSAIGLVRRMETASALAVTPLPMIAVYLSAPEFLVASDPVLRCGSSSSRAATAP